MSRKRFTITATVYNKKRKVIGYGVNQYDKTHPLQKYFGTLAGNPNQKSIHAELSAMLSAGRHKVDSIFVQRYTASGLPANARPCPSCVKMLKAFGVRIAKYTHEDGIKELDLESI